MDRQALVTGATGFVGSHLTERLTAEGWRICALVRRTSKTSLLDRFAVERAEGDLGDDSGGEVIARAVRGVDTVFHLAAATKARDANTYWRVNADGTRRIVEACSRAQPPPRRFVYLSSYAAGGPVLNGRARSVSDPPAPFSAYGRSKLEGERIARTLEESGVEVVVVRAPVVYGPRDRDLLTYFRLVARGIAPYPAGPTRRLHVIFAPDLARALARSATAAPGTWAVAEPVEHSFRALIETIARVLHRRPLYIAVPQPVLLGAAAVTESVAGLFGRAVAFSRDKAREMLAPGWLHELPGTDELLPPGSATPLERGIADTAHWYRQQGWL